MNAASLLGCDGMLSGGGPWTFSLFPVQLVLSPSCTFSNRRKYDSLKQVLFLLYLSESGVSDLLGKHFLPSPHMAHDKFRAFALDAMEFD